MEEYTRDSMINMHLDTYFNIAGDGIAVTSVDLAKKANGVVMGKESPGVYRKGRSLNLYDYMREKNFSFINLRLSEQMGYSSNFLTLSNRKILTVNVKDVIQKLMSRKVFSEMLDSKVRSDLEKAGSDKLFPDRKELTDFGIDNITLELSELTGGYGGAHCMTAALNRT
jgi:arginine deiminase